MGISVADNFDHKSKKPLDARTSYATLALMKAVTDANMYEGCEAYCAETDKYYQFKSTNTVDESTGKWRERSGSGAGTDTTAYHSDDTVTPSIADADYFPLMNGGTTKRTLWSTIKSHLANVFQPKLTAGQSIEITNANVINAQMPVMGTFSKGDLYDTAEKVIGKWVDGRPLYQISVSTTTPSTSSTDKTVLNLGTDVSIVGIKGTCYAQGNIWVDIPYGDGAFEIVTFYEAGKVCIRINSGDSIWYSKTAYLTVQYTKTTDSANSYNYANENDYSTTEHVIGTWINGETLYQRTYSKTFPSSFNSAYGIINIATSFTYTPVEILGYSYYKEGTTYGSLQMPYYDGTCAIVFQTNTSTKTLEMYYTNGSGLSYLKSRPYYVTIKYIK